jgi:hypothetical protein
VKGEKGGMKLSLNLEFDGELYRTSSCSLPRSRRK